MNQHQVLSCSNQYWVTKAEKSANPNHIDGNEKEGKIRVKIRVLAENKENPVSYKNSEANS